MRQVLWEPSAGALLAFLNSNTQALPVDLYTFTLQNGTVLRFTDCEVPLTVDGVAYLVGPVLKRTRTRFTVGISVDTMDLDIYADSSVQVNGVSMITAIALGMFDGADVRVNHVFYDTTYFADIKGVIAAFAGRVGQVSTQRGQASMQVRSYSELFDIMVPGDLYQAGCKNTLYDAYCGINRATAGAGSTVSAVVGTNNNKFSASGIPTTYQTSGTLGTHWADMGVVTFTSGANNGVSRTVKKQTVAGAVSTFEFIAPFPYPIEVGASFDCFPGCDKTAATCTGKWNNRDRFRGEPFVPPPESIV